MKGVTARHALYRSVTAVTNRAFVKQQGRGAEGALIVRHLNGLVPVVTVPLGATEARSFVAQGFSTDREKAAESGARSALPVRFIINATGQRIGMWINIDTTIAKSKVGADSGCRRGGEIMVLITVSEIFSDSACFFVSEVVVKKMIMGGSGGYYST
jgi:hypothetical protein